MHKAVKKKKRDRKKYQLATNIRVFAKWSCNIRECRMCSYKSRMTSISEICFDTIYF